MNIETARQMTQQLFPPDGTDFCCTLCGSALQKAKPRDVDLMIFVDGQVRDWILKLTENLIRKGVEWSERSIPELELESMKFQFQKNEYSLHITERSKIDEYLAQIENVSVYERTNIFGFERNLSTIYRCWIQETRFIGGNEEMIERFGQKIQQSEIPFEELKVRFARKLSGTVKYMNEKEALQNTMFSGILLMQIFNMAVQYCFAANHQFFGTLKYLETDLRNFQVEREIVDLTLQIFESFSMPNLLRSIQCSELLVQKLGPTLKNPKEK